MIECEFCQSRFDNPSLLSLHIQWKHKLKPMKKYEDMKI